MYGDLAKGKAYHAEVVERLSRIYAPLVPTDFCDALIALREKRYDACIEFVRFRLNRVRESNQINPGLVAILIYSIMQTQHNQIQQDDLVRLSSMMQYVWNQSGRVWIDHWQMYHDMIAMLKSKWGEDLFNQLWARGNPETMLEQLLTWQIH
jgi:hypothetical protein